MFKAYEIARRFGGKIVTITDALRAMADPTKGIIVVVNNGPFQAAAFAFDMDEFDEFHRAGDIRPKQYVILDREIAEKASGYKN